MYLSPTIMLTSLAALTVAATSKTSSMTTSTKRTSTAAPSSATCTPPSPIYRDYYNFSLRVNGHSEGAPELEIAWEDPNTPLSPGHLILSTTPMTGPLLSFLNGNDLGKLCDQFDLCSDLDVPSGADEFQGFGFFGQDPNALPPFEVYAICDADGKPSYALRPRHDSGYESFAVTSFAEGSRVLLRKNGQVGIGSDVMLKIVQH
ncbi:MAG: hypothetical protein Q9218_006228 [Villophora microphyllina]